MSSSDIINGVIDTIIGRITTNLVVLGLTSISERDEDPMYINPPEAYAVPFVEGRDTIKLYSNGEEHTYPLHIIGFYKYQDTATPATAISAGLRPTRDYGLAALDLFTRANATITGTSALGVPCGGEIVDATLEVGYWRVADYAMHYWGLNLQVKQII